MLDYAIAIAPEWHEAIKSARTAEAEQRAWLRKLRDIERAGRGRRRRPRNVIGRQPATLAAGASTG